jgi:predicted glycogen debranching enzyme
VSGVDVHVECPSGRIALSSQRYAPGVVSPDGTRRIAGFAGEPWPSWTLRVDDSLGITFETFVALEDPCVVLRWRTRGPARGARLAVRPFLADRSYHALHAPGAAPSFEARNTGPGRVRWTAADGVSIVARSNGAYAHDPHVYRSFVYEAERERGFDFEEDLFSPGEFLFDLDAGDAVVTFAEGDAASPPDEATPVPTIVASLESSERSRRAAFTTRLERAADAYLVRRPSGRTIVAGYPWFADWGRDTFISLRGLCLAAGRPAVARDILIRWSRFVSDGMLPNRFPDDDGSPEYNSVDASLWFVIAAGELLAFAPGADGRPSLDDADRSTLRRAVLSIVAGYSRGARHGIRPDRDGLLRAGETGSQLTWMDARANGAAVTPRVGKPVEVQALWINALDVAARLDPRWSAHRDRAAAAFEPSFWNESRSCLFDVVDVNGVPGRVDPAVRPNQILAVGGLPVPVLRGPRARAVVDAVERELATPVGLRTLAPAEPGYAARYGGDPTERDGAYHQGTVWPWLIGPFVEAWVRVRGGTTEAKREARARFLAPLLERLDGFGLGHLPEIADGDPPHAPNGCPFQAWSVAEALRLDLDVLSEAPHPRD